TVFALVLFSNCKGVKKHNSAYDKVNVQEDEKEYSFSQNFTSKYNILYNANLMLENEQEAIFNSSSKNYQIRQTVFDEPTAEGDAHTLMDSLITKVYKIVNKKQESKYVNEAYFILGKANYLKGAYHTSIEFFNQLLRSAEDQQEYLPLAFAWKSRALLQIGKAEQAKTMIDSAYITLDDNKSTRTFVNAARANYLIRTGDEQKAIPYLEYALESNKNRLDKMRWQFLLAQLYKEYGEANKALQYFSKISKGNVPFDMAFEASLQSSFLKGEKYSSVNDQVKPLLRMLREGKNEGYQDQILFQAGEVYFQKGHPEQAVTYYKRSLAQPTRNNYQATETYLKLGDYYFDQKNYLTSQSYYDSAAMVLPTDYTDVNKVRKKLGYMAEITGLFHDISHKDTLLNLAALNERDLDSTVSQYAAAQLEIEKKRYAEETAQA
ncbi:tetratricopeptide repeat protein, partial [Parapusillimonas sp. SGNA-6]|nr:tetratricopeptide repeat protein [Parapusillimonas sp. SGNA-6]